MSNETQLPSVTNPDKLPSIAEIYANDDMSVIHRDSAFQHLVNQKPKDEWLKAHPSITVKQGDKYVPLVYLPIQRVEWLLINVFVKYKVEVKAVQLIGNSVTVTVRLWYYDHINKDWLWQDGIGAAPLQTDKGAGAVDFNAMKSGAVQMAAPAAESYATKDAAEKIGRLFGRDLNRAESLSFEALKDKYAKAMADD